MYIYIFEDGTTEKHASPPTRVDCEMIVDGTLMVLKCGGDVQYVSEDGSLGALTECVLDTDGDCHVPS